MINYQLCKEFPAYTPYMIDESVYSEVIDLYSDLRRLQISEKKNTKVDKHGNVEKVIRKRAGNNWF